MIQRETSTSDIGPVRTCIGCRRRELAVDLLRIVAVSNGNDESVVTVDTSRSLPGRGAWLHPDPQCLSAAIRRRAFGRALRITGSPDTSAVVESFDALSGAESSRPTRQQKQVAKNMSTP